MECAGKAWDAEKWRERKKQMERAEESRRGIRADDRKKQEDMKCL